MSNTKMLIDATHPEETRVVVQRNGRVEEFDFESAARKLLRGNIYLAKVTRVEPSLQAAFVDYGGNRHGFLAFNEIHPDYYQIPVADRQALIDEEAAAEAELEAAADRRAEALARRTQGRRPDISATASEISEPHRDESLEEPGDAAPDASHIIDVEEDEHIEEVGGEADGSEAPQSFATAIDRGGETISEDYAPRAPHTSAPAHGQEPHGTDADVSAAEPHFHHEAEDDEDPSESESDDGDQPIESDHDSDEERADDHHNGEHGGHEESAGRAGIVAPCQTVFRFRALRR